MLSKKARATWLTSIREVEDNLCDAEALCLVKDDDHPDVYRMFFNARGLDTAEGTEKETLIYDEYDLRNEFDAKRLVRNIVALYGGFPDELKKLGEGVSFADDEAEDKGTPVLLHIVEGERELPYIEILHERAGRESLENGFRSEGD